MIKISDEMNRILTIVANEGSTKRQRQRKTVCDKAPNWISHNWYNTRIDIGEVNHGSLIFLVNFVTH